MTDHLPQDAKGVARASAPTTPDPEPPPTDEHKDCRLVLTNALSALSWATGFIESAKPSGLFQPDPPAFLRDSIKQMLTHIETLDGLETKP